MKQLIEMQLFGPIVSFIDLGNITHIEIEQYENYQKMSYRNRYQLLSSNGVLNLSVPIVGGRDQKCRSFEVEVDYTGRWMQEHWRTLESNYNHSPYFEHYAPSLRELWNKKPSKLAELCELSLKWVLKQLKWEGSMTYTELYVKNVEREVRDDRNRFQPKNRMLHTLPFYHQQFGNQFETNLSILDLLFNLGPQAARYLNAFQHSK